MRRLLSLLLVLLTCHAAHAQRDTIRLNDDWQFLRIAENEPMPQHFDQLQFRDTVRLPHDFQIEQPWVAPAADEKGDASNVAANIKSRLSSRGFKALTKGIYRKYLTPDASWRDKRVVLDLGGIMLVGDVYLNGQHIGQTDYGYLGFECDLTPHLRYDQPNVLIVTAETQHPLSSRWYTGGGLYRDVHLVLTHREHYFNRHPLYITTKDNREVHIQADFRYMENVDSVRLGVRILDAQGQAVYARQSHLKYYRNWRSHEYTLPTITLSNPQLWDTEHPYLYTAEVTLYNAKGEALDCVRERFGVRTIEYGPSYGFRLNGRKVLLKGNANHHTLGALGAAAYPRAIEKRLRLLKSFGFNCIRCSHNPYSEDLYRLCDELGMLVVDELYDKWLKQFSGDRVEWTQQWQHDLTEWVKRDRNHPSVILWSLGNELQQQSNMAYNDWGVTNYRLLTTLLHRYDTTRPTTVAMHPRYRSLETNDIPSPLAIATEVNSYNYRYMYFPGDSKLYPEKTFFQSEASTASMGPNYYEMDLAKVIGLAYWGSIDYIGESGGWPAKGWAQGSFDLSLQPKPIAYLLKSMFSDEPTVHIGIQERGQATRMWNGVNVGTAYMSENWNRTEGDTLKVNVFTNAEKVVLLQNGKAIAEQQNTLDPKSRNRLTFSPVIYTAGTLEAVAYNKEKVVARHKLQTAGEATQLRLTPDVHTWHADGQDLMHVAIQATDKKGIPVLTAQHEITCSVEGEGTVIAVSNGDITSDHNLTGSRVRLFQGKALIILRATQSAGPVTLRVKTNGMKESTIRLRTH